MEKRILIKIPEGERPVMEVVWENIEKYRQENNIPIHFLCKHVGYSPSNYFRNKKNFNQIMPNTIQLFAEALGVKTLDLFEDWSFIENVN